jgi:hypothetical protein
MSANLADEVYTTLYEIVVVQILPTFSTFVFNLAGGNWFNQILMLAVGVLALAMMYQKIDMLIFLKSFIVIFITGSLFSHGGIFLLGLMQDLFINLPIKIGGLIVNVIGHTIYAGNADLSNLNIQIQPNADGSTAFGVLWQMSTDLASSVWNTGGMSNMGALFLGGALYAVAIFLLVAQIFVLGTALLMATVAIFLAPIFIPMILFKQTRSMFQSWVGFGLGGAFGLLILLVMMGIVFGFITLSFYNMFGVDISTSSVDQLDDINDISKISGLLLFMIITIKLLPQVSGWATSLAGASAGGISEGLTQLGTSFAKNTGLLAKKAATKAGEKIGKPLATNVMRGIGNKFNSLNNRNKTPTTKNNGRNNLLKASITQRLAQRTQSGNQRPLAKHAGIEKQQNKVNSLSKIKQKALSHRPNATAQQVKKATEQSGGSSSRPIGASTKTAKGSHNSTNAQTPKEPGIKNPGQSPGQKEQKEVSRPAVANSSKASSTPKSSSETSSRTQEPTKHGDGRAQEKNKKQSPTSSAEGQKAVNREKVIEKKTQISKEKKNNLGTNTQPPATVQNKSINRDKNLSKPSRAQRAEQKQQIDPKLPKPTKEVKRREDSTIKKAKIKHENEKKK